MKTKDYTGLSASSTRPFRRPQAVLITLLVLCATSCRSPKGLTQTQRSDSIQSTRRSEMILMPIPSSTTQVTIPAQALTTLPRGAGYSSRSGQAAVTIDRGRGDTIVVTATCDSLSRQVILLEEELTRVRGETVKEQIPPQVSILHEPTGWQWFQIWTGRIAVAALVLIIIRRRFKK